MRILYNSGMPSLRHGLRFVCIVCRLSVKETRQAFEISPGKPIA